MNDTPTQSYPTVERAIEEAYAEWQKGNCHEDDCGCVTVYIERALTAPIAALVEAAENHRERVAQLTAHRACCGTEHDPANGKLHGYCVVCGVPWPCEFAMSPWPKQVLSDAENRARNQALEDWYRFADSRGWDGAIALTQKYFDDFCLTLKGGS